MKPDLRLCIAITFFAPGFQHWTGFLPFHLADNFADRTSFTGRLIGLSVLFPTQRRSGRTLYLMRYPAGKPCGERGPLHQTAIVTLSATAAVLVHFWKFYIGSSIWNRNIPTQVRQSDFATFVVASTTI